MERLLGHWEGIVTQMKAELHRPDRYCTFVCASLVHRLCATSDDSENSEIESCTDRCSSQFENNYFTEMCSRSEAGSYLRLIGVSLNSRLESNR